MPEDRSVPPDAPHRTPYRRLVVTGALLAALPLAAACGAPPERRPAAPSTPPRPAVSAPPALPTATPAATPTLGALPPGALSPSPAPGLVAAPCAGRPTADRVTGLLRDAVLPRDVPVRATEGPLCADGWQYTVLAVTGHEELQVVTRGRPDALELVTAGTDVCSVEVRAAAPAGIRALACDAGTQLLPGA
ncbi:hypothetical protein [Micromonospora sp. DT47]|uniref:hypothetical protein n=1 Tax=Micromonospora sp. DT47 TaxID=3393431 RepID=UPI003CE6BD5D